MADHTTQAIERPTITLSYDFINMALPVLTGAELKLYIILCSVHAESGQEWFPVASKDLVAMTGLSRSQVYASMWQLLAYRFIDKKAQMWSDGGTAPNLYRILPLPDEVWE